MTSDEKPLTSCDGKRLLNEQNGASGAGALYSSEGAASGASATSESSPIDDLRSEYQRDLVGRTCGGSASSADCNEPPTGSLAGGESATSTVLPLFCNAACRDCRKCNIHPLCASPIPKRKTFFVASSIKMPTTIRSLITVPISESWSSSGSGGGTTTGVTRGVLSTGVGAGRRESEKIGLSRVSDNRWSGIAKTGFPTRGGLVSRAIAASTGKPLSQRAGFAIVNQCDSWRNHDKRHGDTTEEHAGQYNAAHERVHSAPQIRRPSRVSW